MGTLVAKKKTLSNVVSSTRNEVERDERPFFFLRFSSLHNAGSNSCFGFKKNLNAAKHPEQSKCLGGKIDCKADSYAYEKLILKWTKSVFFVFFSILWVREWSRFVWPNPYERFVTGLQTDLVPKSVCSSDTNLQTDFARGATITTFGQ